MPAPTPAARAAAFSRLVNIGLELVTAGMALSVEVDARSVRVLFSDAPNVATPTHAPDWSRLEWPGLGTFRFTPKQRVVVERLWAAMEAGEPHVGQRELLTCAGSDGTRLADLFKRSEAWGRLIVAGATPGTYTLPEGAKP